MRLNAPVFGEKKEDFNFKLYLENNTQTLDKFIKKKKIERKEDDDINFLLDDYLENGRKPKNVNYRKNYHKKGSMKKLNSQKNVESK